ncbi:MULTISPECIES: hypothetical protein [unclassified Devosia]|uniref:hypothetical protein n=1 Tax=unclassified Devosia TaxID=196773 RepID=UPI00155463AD|nr:MULTISPECIES: hypothetical protein [unclassified Devosia]
MKRTLTIASLLAGSVALPATAADYGYGGMRTAYPTNWQIGEDNPLRFEAGVRYWYSLGQQSLSLQGYEQDIKSTSHSGEAFVRIDDDSTRSFLEANVGYAFATSGDYSTDGIGGTFDLPGARLGYVGADFGMMPFGNESFGVGAVIGYQYFNESPDTGRASFTTARSASDIAWSSSTGDWSIGFDSEPNNFDIHAAKIGLVSRFEVADAFDITAEAAALPYAWVDGTLGTLDLVPEDFGGNTFLASAASVGGYAYGAAGKLMVGFHPTENLTVRIGGRASYLQGEYDATFDTATVTPPQPSFQPDGTPADPAYTAPNLSRQSYISTNNPFTFFRYGALFELAGRF